MDQLLILAAIFLTFPVLSFTPLYKLVPVINRPAGYYKTKRGGAMGLVVFIEAGNVYQESILPHELEHVRQMWLTCFFGHAILYRLSKRYRLWSEARAFAVSVKNGRPLADCAYWLANGKLQSRHH